MNNGEGTQGVNGSRAVDKEKPTGVSGRLLAGSPVVHSGRCETTPLSHRQRSRIIAAGKSCVVVRLASSVNTVKR